MGALGTGSRPAAGRRIEGRTGDPGAWWAGHLVSHARANLCFAPLALVWVGGGLGPQGRWTGTSQRHSPLCRRQLLCRRQTTLANWAFIVRDLCSRSGGEKRVRTLDQRQATSPY